jgi:hypothetical protein
METPRVNAEFATGRSRRYREHDLKAPDTVVLQHASWLELHTLGMASETAKSEQLAKIALGSGRHAGGR